MRSTAVVPLLVAGIAACGGKKLTQAAHQDFDLRAFLPAGVVPPPADSMQVYHATVRVGPDSLETTLQWKAFARGANRYLESASIDIPPHDSAVTIDAGITPAPLNRGTADAALEAMQLQLQWSRHTSARSELGTVVGFFLADGHWERY